MSHLWVPRRSPAFSLHTAPIGGSRVDVMRQMVTVREIVGLAGRRIEVGHLPAELRCGRCGPGLTDASLTLPDRFEWCRW